MSLEVQNYKEEASGGGRSFSKIAAPGILLKANLSWGTGLSFHRPVIQLKEIQMSHALLPCVEVLRVEVLHLIQLLSEGAILLSCTYLHFHLCYYFLNYHLPWSRKQ